VLYQEGMADDIQNILGIKTYVGRNNQRALRRMAKFLVACAATLDLE
jgi:hypothetical protein